MTTNDARAVDGTRIPSESAIVRADLVSSVTKNLLALLPIEADTGTVVLVTEVSDVEHRFGVGIKPLMGLPGQPVLPCSYLTHCNV